MPCYANCDCHLGRRAWFWNWTSGGPPTSGWVENPVVHDGSDGDDDEPDIPWSVKIPLFICKQIGNFLGSVLTVFLLWLIFFRPYKVRPHVDSATLSRFDYAVPGPPPAANALWFNLTLDVSFFNNHRIYGIRFNHLTAELYYNGTEIGPADDTLPTFYQKPRRTKVVHPWLQGRAANVSAGMAEEFARQRREGYFEVDVRMKTTLTYRFWPHRAVYYYEYDCWLRFPAPTSAKPGVTGDVKCGVHK